MARARKARVKCAEEGCLKPGVKDGRCGAHYTARWRLLKKTGEAVPRVDLGYTPARLFFFVREEEATFFRSCVGKGQASAVLRTWFHEGIRALGYEPPP